MIKKVTGYLTKLSVCVCQSTWWFNSRLVFFSLWMYVPFRCVIKRRHLRRITNCLSNHWLWWSGVIIFQERRSHADHWWDLFKRWRAFCMLSAVKHVRHVLREREGFFFKLSGNIIRLIFIVMLLSALKTSIYGKRTFEKPYEKW